MDNRGNGIDYLEEKSNYAGFENIVKQQCKINTDIISMASLGNKERCTKMTDEHKQILEMAKRICTTIHKKELEHCEISCDVDCIGLAQELTKYYQPKLADDEMIIIKEDYELLKTIEKAYDPIWFCTFGGCEGARKECKNTCEMSIFVKERKQILDDLHNEFSRYKCYEHADKYLREYATKRGIKLEE